MDFQAAFSPYGNATNRAVDTVVHVVNGVFPIQNDGKILVSVGVDAADIGVDRVPTADVCVIQGQCIGGRVVLRRATIAEGHGLAAFQRLTVHYDTAGDPQAGFHLAIYNFGCRAATVILDTPHRDRGS